MASDSIKEVATTAATLVATAASMTEPITALAAGAVAFAFEHVRARDRKRAQRILEHVLAADDSPEELALMINARLVEENEDVVAVFRALLLASFEAAELAALEPMAQIARRRLRDQCPLWFARGALRVLADLEALELAALREVLVYADEARHFGGVRYFLARSDDNMTDVLRTPTGRLFAAGHGRRLTQLLRQHGLAAELAFTPGKHKESAFAGESELYLPDPVTAELRAAFRLPEPATVI